MTNDPLSVKKIRQDYERSNIEETERTLNGVL